MFYQSLHRKASSEGRTFVTNKVGNLAFAPGKEGEKAYKTVRESFITNKVLNLG